MVWTSAGVQKGPLEKSSGPFSFEPPKESRWGLSAGDQEERLRRMSRRFTRSAVWTSAGYKKTPAGESRQTFLLSGELQPT